MFTTTQSAFISGIIFTIFIGIILQLVIWYYNKKKTIKIPKRYKSKAFQFKSSKQKSTAHSYNAREPLLSSKPSKSIANHDSNQLPQLWSTELQNMSSKPIYSGLNTDNYHNYKSHEINQPQRYEEDVINPEEEKSNIRTENVMETAVCPPEQSNDDNLNEAYIVQQQPLDDGDDYNDSDDEVTSNLHDHSTIIHSPEELSIHQAVNSPSIPLDHVPLNTEPANTDNETKKKKWRKVKVSTDQQKVEFVAALNTMSWEHRRDFANWIGKKYKINAIQRAVEYNEIAWDIEWCFKYMYGGGDGDFDYRGGDTKKYVDKKLKEENGLQTLLGAGNLSHSNTTNNILLHAAENNAQFAVELFGHLMECNVVATKRRNNTDNITNAEFKNLLSKISDTLPEKLHYPLDPISKRPQQCTCKIS